MIEWHSMGYFTPDLMVKKIYDDEFQPLKDRKDLNLKFPIENSDKNLSVTVNNEANIDSSQEAPALNQQDAYYYNVTSAYSNPGFPSGDPETPIKPTNYVTEYEDYVISGSFNVVSGKFQRQDSSTYFQSKNLPEDRAGRQLAHYFDVSVLENQKLQKAKPDKSKSKKKKKQKTDNDSKGLKSPQNID